MPTYEYRCKACSLDLEVVQSFTDDALTTCGACGGQLRKLFGNVGIAFKGSGFYKNDSRRKATNGAAAEKAGSDKVGSDTGGGDKSKSDSGSSTKKDTAASSSGSSSTGETAKSSPKNAPKRTPKSA